jgi:thiamine-monophosphate kinase
VEVLADLGEDELLDRILPLFAVSPVVLVPAGDDAALLAATDSVLATTDAMVRGRDWLEAWSSAQDVGAKVVAQNVADIAAMGGVPTGLLVTLVADPRTPVAWVEEFSRGLAAAAGDAGVAVVGGDLSSAPEGTLVVSVTALGDLEGRDPVLRSGARVGDLVAVSGSLGRSAAGLLLLEQGREEEAPELVAAHRRPRPTYEQGPLAALAGASAMLDLSDGLVRDGRRVARASGVQLALTGEALAGDVRALVGAVGPERARDCVLTGGEEHSLLACFPADRAVPEGWRVLGEVRTGAGLTLDGQHLRGGGWDHFGPGREDADPS